MRRQATPRIEWGHALSLRLALFFPLAILLLVGVFAASAQAAPETIAEFGEDAGQVNTPRGVTVEQSSGAFYVADRNNFRIDKFAVDGDFLLAWGSGVRDGLPGLETCGPQASPPSSHCRKGSGTNAGAITPAAVAVDQSSGAVYVVEVRRVSKYTSAGAFLFMVGRNVNKTKVATSGATQAEKNICTAASGDTCGSAENGTGADEFSSPLSLAVDSSGVVWVGDNNRIASFSATGAAGAQITMSGAGETASLALDSAGNFYVISQTQSGGVVHQALPGVRRLHSGTGTLMETLDAAGFPRAVTVDQAGKVFVGDCGSSSVENCPAYQFKIYDAAGHQTYQFGDGQVIGGPRNNALAITESIEKLYVASSHSAATESVLQAFPASGSGPLIGGQGIREVLPTTATATASINPEGKETTYRFEYGTSESYGLSTSTRTLGSNAFEGEGVEAQLEELRPDTTYHFRVVATNHCNSSQPAEECTAHGEDETFTTLPAIRFGAQWVTDVTTTTAEVNGELDPLGAEAEAWLEYGSDESYGQVVPLANIGNGFGAIARVVSLTGLQPNATYHYRFAARDERDGVVYALHGPDGTFATQFASFGFQLPDERAWEMVSPSEKHGARPEPAIEGSTIQAAADGNGLAYLSLGAIEADPEGNRLPERSDVLALRDTAGGWSSKDITPPNTSVTPFGVGDLSPYDLFTPDLSSGMLKPSGVTPLSLEASERTPYLWEDGDPPIFVPLVTGKEGYANVPPGTEFGGEPSQPTGPVHLVGASPDLRHIALFSGVPLVSGAPANAVYGWTGGALRPISVLPAAEGGAIVAAKGVGSVTGSVDHAVSQDGSRVFWSVGDYGPAGGNGLKGLYMRDTVSEKTVRIDLVQPGGLGSGEAKPVFQGASSDGRVVYFTDTQRLTGVSSPSGADLYRCEIPLSAPVTGCATLTDLSVPVEAGLESAEVQGMTPALSDDGSAIYFVATGVLSDSPNSVGDWAEAGDPNLYLWQEGDGVRFIATLGAEDSLDWGKSPAAAAALGSLVSAAASPGGRYLSFMSQRSLTGYANRDSQSREVVQEVYRYDAVSDRLDCVSCNPTGARPLLSPAVAGNLVDPREVWRHQGVAATVPEPTESVKSGPSFYRPRAVLDNGRVFFNSLDSLVPADSNGQWDVYEYEPMGVGDCSPSSGGAATARSAGGCVSLISSGTAEKEAGFLDASISGDDIFFLTSAQLNEPDEDQEYDVYDARVGGIPATRAHVAECLGEACQPAAQAPNDATPASSAFSGDGNVKPHVHKHCDKVKRRVGNNGRHRCVPRKHRHRRHRHRQGQSARRGR